MGKRKIIIGTRGSILAVKQAEIVLNMMKKIFNDQRFQIKKIKTSGDKNLDKSMFDDSLKNMFVKEIEIELLEGKIDMAVHSLKDMPVRMTEGLCIGAIPVREDPRDVLISKNSIKFCDLKTGAVIGTSSLRRKKQIEMLRDDIETREIRGNIQTRIKKLSEGFDAIILAGAGLKRTGLDNIVTEYFDVDKIVPAPGQGALCVQCRCDDKEIKNILMQINDEETENIVTAEREFGNIFESGCKSPIGAYGYIDEDKLVLMGMYFYDNKIFKDKITGNKKNPLETAKKLADAIKGKIK